MQATFYSGFKKRINSTKRPSGGTTYNVFMKDKTDMHRPTIKVNTSNCEYNYFTLNGHYFYVTSAVVMPNAWVEYTGQLDSMAECADDIKATTAFILRSSSGTTSLIDTLSPGTSKVELLTNQSRALPWAFSGGRYIVGFTNLLQPAVMTEGEIQNLYERLNAPDVIDQFKDLLTGGIRDYITGAVWLPMNVPAGGSIALKTNSVDLGISVSLMLVRYETNTTVFEFSDIDDGAWSTSQYCEMNMYLPFVGNVQLSVDSFKHSKSMQVQTGIDYGTGGLFYIIKAGAEIVATFNGTCASSIPIGYSGANGWGIAGGGIMAIAGIATGSLPMIAAGAASAYKSVRGSTGQLSSGSGNKSFAMDTNIQVSITRKNVPESMGTKSAVVGLPTYKTMALSSVSGYIECYNATIESDAEPSAVEECNGYLNSGAWIE